ncbi:MAG UNVERIFIED_CONTAM: hypothetical protein LVR29_03010 [Microcystis novacekii LVE1205-3]|jgi:hypothetical protein
MARMLVERYPWAQDFLSQADRWLQEAGLAPDQVRLIYRPLESSHQSAKRWKIGSKP